jgi:hypothetical protein
VEFIKGFIQKNAIMEKTFLAVVPFFTVSVAAAAKSAQSFIPFFNKKKNAAEETKDAEEAERVFQENLAQLNQRVSQVMTGLLSIGLEATVLEDQALVELFYNFYNPQTIERKNMALPNQQ